ncbi:ABC transporter ATP-binding protein [Streptomyces sp. NPDC001880]
MKSAKPSISPSSGDTATTRARTGGAATVAGHDLADDPAAVRTRCGYVAQSGGVDPHLTVREELVTQGRLYRLSRAEASERAAELARLLDLGDLLDRKAATLSGGQRRRLDIAMGIVHRPPVLFLDEPTTGLDPGSRSGLWDLVRGLRDDHGTTVVLTTHYLDEADALADRLIVIDRGVVVAEGAPWTRCGTRTWARTPPRTCCTERWWRSPSRSWPRRWARGSSAGWGTSLAAWSI